MSHVQNDRSNAHGEAHGHALPAEPTPAVPNHESAELPWEMDWIDIGGEG